MSGEPSPSGREEAERVLPPVYPWSAFESRRWVEAQRIPIIPRDPPAGAFEVHSESEEMRHRLTSEFDQIAFDRVGLLRGEFVALQNGLILVDRAGAHLTVNFPAGGTSSIAQMPYNEVNQLRVWDYVQSLRERWDEIPVVENGAIFSHIFHRNYYHFSFEFLQKFRLIDSFGIKSVAMPPIIYEGGVYRELIARTLGDRVLVPTNQPVRFRNPVLADAYQSDEGLRWLRQLVGKTLQPLGERYYVRRSPPTVRRGNNISEDPRFSAFLQRHHFQTVDFGNGELSLHEQIDKLKGASLVLAPHGAGLTNISYLNPPVTVIEVFSRAVISNSFIRISEALGFEHHAIISEEVDPQGDIVVDCDLLERLVAGATAA